MAADDTPTTEVTVEGDATVVTNPAPAPESEKTDDADAEGAKDE